MTWQSWLHPGLERWRIREEIKRLQPLTPSSREGSVVAVTGTVCALGPPLIAPLSQRPCVWFDSSCGSFHDRGAHRFELVRDVGGPIVVDPTHAHVALPRMPSDGFYNLRAYAIRIEQKGWDGLPPCDETIVQPGARLWVAAVLAREAVAADPYRDTASDLVLVGDPEVGPLVIVDID